jgi:hypothetical protein
MWLRNSNTLLRDKWSRPTLFAIFFKLACLAKYGSTQGTYIQCPLWSALLLQYEPIKSGQWWKGMEHCSKKWHGNPKYPSPEILRSPENYDTGTLWIVYNTNYYKRKKYQFQGQVHATGYHRQVRIRSALEKLYFFTFGHNRTLLLTYLLKN